MQVGQEPAPRPRVLSPGPRTAPGAPAPTSAARRRLEVAARPLSRCGELRTPREPALCADWQLTGEKWAAGSSWRARRHPGTAGCFSPGASPGPCSAVSLARFFWWRFSAEEGLFTHALPVPGPGHVLSDTHPLFTPGTRHLIQPAPLSAQGSERAYESPRATQLTGG